MPFISIGKTLFTGKTIALTSSAIILAKSEKVKADDRATFFMIVAFMI